MILNSLTKRYLIAFVVFSTLVSIIYLCISSLQENVNSVQSGYRCMSELNSIKYQLNVVTEYKNLLDKLLTETQKTHNADKDRFKDILESCTVMKQQVAICQSQFEDLQSECKIVKANYDEMKKDAENLKNH